MGIFQEVDGTGQVSLGKYCYFLNETGVSIFHFFYFYRMRTEQLHSHKKEGSEKKDFHATCYSVL